MFIFCYNLEVSNSLKDMVMSRLSIELTPEEHQKIKAIAALKNSSIKEYVLERILPSDSAQISALQELKRQ